MGSFIEINDTLQLTDEQGFPKELNYEQHEAEPFLVEDFQDKIFEFKDKPAVRLYQLPPVRNFLVQNIDGKWLYWGLVHVIEVAHDNVNKTTSGKFRIIQFFSPEEMKHAYNIVGPSKAGSYLE